jgi:hypothetical protein
MDTMHPLTVKVSIQGALQALGHIEVQKLMNEEKTELVEVLEVKLADGASSPKVDPRNLMARQE